MVETDDPRMDIRIAVTVSDAELRGGRTQCSKYPRGYQEWRLPALDAGSD